MKVSEKARSRACQLLLQVNIARMELDRYIEGLQDALGLEGVWNLNTNTGEFTEIAPEGDEEAPQDAEGDGDE